MVLLSMVMKQYHGFFVVVVSTFELVLVVIQLAELQKCQVCLV
jgi:hypothetical protein